MRSLAAELGIATSTAHRSLAHPVEIDALSVSTIDGLQVLDPARLLTLFTAHRRIQRDIVWRYRVAGEPAAVERAAHDQGAILGGFAAVVAHLGVNRIAEYNTVLAYGDAGWLADLVAAEPGDGTEVLVAEADPWLSRYGSFTPVAQAYADLFCLPGWQAARFVSELDPRRIAASDRPVLLV